MIRENQQASVVWNWCHGVAMTYYISQFRRTRLFKSSSNQFISLLYSSTYTTYIIVQITHCKLLRHVQQQCNHHSIATGATEIKRGFWAIRRTYLFIICTRNKGNDRLVTVVIFITIWCWPIFYLLPHISMVNTPMQWSEKLQWCSPLPIETTPTWTLTAERKERPMSHFSQM